jgi:hypothetical protein
MVLLEAINQQLRVRLLLFGQRLQPRFAQLGCDSGVAVRDFADA